MEILTNAFQNVKWRPIHLKIETNAFKNVKWRQIHLKIKQMPLEIAVHLGGEGSSGFGPSCAPARALRPARPFSNIFK